MKGIFMSQWFVVQCLICLLGIGSLAAEENEAVSEVLKGIVNRQATAWNNGDIDGFMEAYWRSEKLTFSSRGETRRGWEATREKYRKSCPDRATMGILTFSNLETEMLSPNVVLMLGEWHLARKDEIGGNFSIVWQKIDGKWVIVHDHSSAKESPRDK